MMIPLQIELAGTKLLDYGLLGIILVAVAYFAWHLFKTQQKYTDEWRSEAKEYSKAFMDLSQQQTTVAQKQVEIQEHLSMQSKEFYDSMNRKMDDLPNKVAEKIKLDRL